MGKISCRVHHKDQALEDHSHRLPNGEYTGGQLLKPNSDQSFPHTHLYQHMGKTLETSPAPIGGDHTHITECGVSSGPVPVHMDARDEWEKKTQGMEDGGPGSGPKEGGGGGRATHQAVAMLKASAKGPSKAYSLNKKKEYEERLKGEKDPHMVAALKQAIAAHSKDAESDYL